MAVTTRLPDWSQAIDEFNAHQDEQERSVNTVINYRGDLLAFAAWHEAQYNEIPKLDELGGAALREWKRHLVDQVKLKPRSVNRKLSALQKFLGWADGCGYARPIQTPKRVSVLTPPPRWMTRREELALLRAVDRGGNVRDIAIVAVFLNVGLRVSELASLRGDQLEVSKRKGTVHVIGKGRKHRDIPLNASVRKALIDLRALDMIGTDKPIFTGQRGPMSARGIQGIVETYAAAAGLPDLSCHVLRHTFCRRLAEAGTRLEVIAALAGHESIETTRQYVEPGRDDLTAAVEAIGGGD
jgi:site-specific recombinase XerD